MNIAGDLKDKMQESIKALQLASKMSEQYYNHPLEIAYSGGKDSDVLLHLAQQADIPIKVVNNHTTADAPQTVRHIRDVFRQLQDKGVKTEIVYPTYKGKRTSMWDLIPQKKKPPTRLVRYCCTVLKESYNAKGILATGVRADESAKRSLLAGFEAITTKHDLRYSFEHVKEVYAEAQEYPEVYDCQFITKMKQQKKVIANPLINWTEADIYTYIHTYSIPLCELYSMGYRRVGCIGCPMASTKGRNKEFADFPKYKIMYLKAFEKMLENIKTTNWETAQDVFDWWMEYKKNDVPGQERFVFEEV